MAERGWNRRAALTRMAGGLILAGTLLPGPALAEENTESTRRVPLKAMSLPGKDRYSYVRLEAVLIVRSDAKLPTDVETVRNMKPRIVGAIMENLSADRLMKSDVTATEVQQLKKRLLDVVNTALGQPLIGDVLIVQLIVT